MLRQYRERSVRRDGWYDSGYGKGKDGWGKNLGKGGRKGGNGRGKGPPTIFSSDGLTPELDQMSFKHKSMGVLLGRANYSSTVRPRLLLLVHLRAFFEKIAADKHPIFLLSRHRLRHRQGSFCRLGRNGLARSMDLIGSPHFFSLFADFLRRGHQKIYPELLDLEATDNSGFVPMELFWKYDEENGGGDTDTFNYDMLKLIEEKSLDNNTYWNAVTELLLLPLPP